MGFAVASASQWTDLTCAFENGPDLSGDLEQVIDVGFLGCALARWCTCQRAAASAARSTETRSIALILGGLWCSRGRWYALTAIARGLTLHLIGSRRARGRDASRNVPTQIAKPLDGSSNERKKVEMRFAHLNVHHRFERMRLRSLTGARDEFHLAAIVQSQDTREPHLAPAAGHASRMPRVRDRCVKRWSPGLVSSLPDEQTRRN
jgi:hypothetical protein